MMTQFKATIYEIYSPSTTMVYIGSTCKGINQRFHTHKSKFKLFQRRGEDIERDCTSYRILAFDDAQIRTIADVEVDDLDELRQMEGSFIRENPNAINKNIAGRDYHQYLKDGSVKIKCSCGYIVAKYNLTAHKKTERHRVGKPEVELSTKQKSQIYYQRNKERIKARVAEYRRKNPNKAKQAVRKAQQKANTKTKRAEKITCSCGATITRGAMRLHIKSKKHTNLSKQF